MKLTEGKAASIANDCIEGITGHLKKADLVAAVWFWSCEASRLAADLALERMTKKTDAAFAELEKYTNPAKNYRAVSKD